MNHPVRPLRYALTLLALAGLPLGALAQDKPEDEAARREREAAAAGGSTGRVKATPLGAQPAKPVPGAQPGATGTVQNPAGSAGAAGAAGAAGGQPTKVPITVTPSKGGGEAAGAQPLKPDEISLARFADGLELKLLVEYVAETLQINVVASDTLQGTVVLNAPVVVKKSELLRLLDALLEQHGFTITLDNQTGFYKVIPIDGVTVSFDGEVATTKVIPTPTIRPSSLTDIINSQIGVVSTGAAANSAGQVGMGRGRVNYLDDLGVIVVTDSARRIQLIEQLVNTVVARSNDQKFLRFELQNIAASVARSRILELVGKGSQNATSIFGQVAAQQPAAVPGLSTGNLDNLSDRLTADAQSNALILRGYDDEAEKITKLLGVLDKPNQLKYKQYFAGSAAAQIAQLGERFGLGTTETVETIASQQNQQNQGGLQPNLRLNQQQQFNPLQPGQNQGGTLGGPVLVVDTSQGTITYYGTESQQKTLAELIEAFNPQLDLVEYRAYKIKNMPATNMSDLLTGLIFNEQVAGSSDTSNSFLPGAGGSSRRGSSSRDRYSGSSSGGSRSSRSNSQFNSNQGNIDQSTRSNTQRTSRQTRPTTGGAGGTSQTGNRPGPVAFTPQGQEPSLDGIATITGQDVFVLADEANNQVVVKATAREHRQISKLIEKLDQRRPQVYIEVQIVSVSSTDDFRLAFETQLINANGTGGAVNTNFGLGSLTTTSGTATSGGFLSRKNVSTTLTGLTAAIIKSDQVPLVITALKKDADTRILSSPQLLVDDNEEAEIVSTDGQPTTGTDIGNVTSSTTFTGYEEAGTTLYVRPSISEGGYMRLEYDITLSNFVGASTSQGIPPPKQTRNVNSSSVTIPGNSTIVVGGIKVDANGKTVVKVPLLGDIPIVGHLFRDTNKNGATTRLYVFITPHIMRDTNFGDLALLTKGPLAEAGVNASLPPLKPVMIELNTPAPQRPIMLKSPPPPTPPAAPATPAKPEDAPKAEGN